jgi:O-acetyl-ADP-ribose deacetylase (regulator of RNase III)
LPRVIAAFPCISTGIYGYPAELAAPLAVDTVRRWLQTPSSLRDVVFCCFSRSDLALYETALSRKE